MGSKQGCDEKNAEPHTSLLLSGLGFSLRKYDPCQISSLFSLPNRPLLYLYLTLCYLQGISLLCHSAGNVEIDLPNPNVTFVKSESDNDLHQIAADEIHDVRAFLKLVPMIDVSVMPFPLFIVQLISFKLMLAIKFH